MEIFLVFFVAVVFYGLYFALIRKPKEKVKHGE